MAKQLIKGLTMLLLVVALSLVTAVASANGQSSKRQTANIPFDFVVGDKEMSAGRYSVQPATSTGETLKISGTENGAAMFRLSSLLQSSKPADKAKLVFHRYGNQYFLAEVWGQGEREGRQLAKSKGEKAIEREYTAIRSRNEQSYQRVEIALVRQ